MLLDELWCFWFNDIMCTHTLMEIGWQTSSMNRADDKISLERWYSRFQHLYRLINLLTCISHTSLCAGKYLDNCNAEDFWLYYSASHPAVLWAPSNAQNLNSWHTALFQFGSYPIVHIVHMNRPMLPMHRLKFGGSPEMMKLELACIVHFSS